MRFDPLVPWFVVVALAVVAVAAFVVRFRRARRERAAWRWSAMAVLALAAAADPTMGGGQVPVKRSDANVLFVVDTTGSMAAEDYGNGQPRLEGVRHDVTELADEFPGAHFSLITWNSKTRIIVPWTTDVGALESAVLLLRQEWTFYAKGTRLDEALPTVRQALPRSGPDGGYDVLFFLSDGEQTATPAPQSFEVLADDIAGGAVLGYGTAAGARMRVYVGRNEEPDQFIHDYETGEDAISRIDERTLTQIAADLDVPYVHRTEPGELGDVADQAAEGAATIYAGQRDAVRRLYWVPALGVVALVLWQFASTTLEIVDSRRVWAAPGRRRVWAVPRTRRVSAAPSRRRALGMRARRPA